MGVRFGRLVTFFVLAVVSASSPRASQFEVTPVVEGREIVALEVRRGGSDAIHQRLEGFAAQYDETRASLELRDLNFDGHLDISLIEFYPPGPNIPYLYWFYDTSSDRFEPVDALNRCYEVKRGNEQIEVCLTSLSFDYERQEVSSSNRSSATTYETCVFVWRDRELQLNRCEQREYLTDNEYRFIVEKPVDGVLRVVQDEIHNER